MDLFDLSFEYIWCLIEAILFTLFLGYILGMSVRISLRKYILISFFISIIIFVLTISNINQSYRMIIGVAIYFIYSLLFEGSLRDKIFYNLLFNLIQIGSEIVVMNLLGFLFSISSEDIISFHGTTRILTGLIVKFCKYIVLAIIANNVNPQENILPKKYNLLVWFLYGLSIVSMIFLFDLTRGLENDVRKLSLVLIFICISYFIINAAIYIFMRELNKYFLKEKEREIIDIHYKAMDRYLKMNEEANLQIRKIRHDLSNHIVNIRNMIADKLDPKINEYVTTIIEDMNKFTTAIKSGNEIADVVLNQKLLEADKYNIKLEINAIIPPELSINPADLSSILFNSIDNAIEASLKIDDIDMRSIKVNIHPRKDYLYFQIINNIGDYAQIQKGRTSKENKMNHGYGLTILEDITNKYDGFMDYEVVDREFKLYMVVSLEKRTASFTEKATSFT